MSDAEPGAGDVPITLGGEELVLVPSLEACRLISKMAGDSLNAAVARIARFDFEFIVEVICLGLNATSAPLKKQVAEKVYHSGVIAVAPDCIEFIRTIMNGGIRPKDGEEPDGEDEDPLASESPLESGIAS